MCKVQLRERGKCDDVAGGSAGADGRGKVWVKVRVNESAGEIAAVDAGVVANADAGASASARVSERMGSEYRCGTTSGTDRSGRVWQCE